ncbi:hypothetical protein N7462_011497 [Penicillium macrosclerotiorum]|uniref:uncharacterized protein n=1 Tax=Penicillium macrosclerotiorum TaxID=303699 RepID=UPI0025477129|nr:uncharacterized protein N7462_011497 [Penicillium macrosclerotiorum]KAJ5664684.1 hypothetical protein N7462_011497 [Penicillium macrosclerotiorum]
MAASVLSTPAASALPLTSSSATTFSSKTNSTQVIVPPNQDIYTLNDLLRVRAAGYTAHDPIVAYPSSGTDYVYYTPNELNILVEAAAVHYAQTIPQRVSSTDPVQVVGLLGLSDFEYLITLLAISRLGHTVLLLSTRIAEDAYVSLLENTKASFIVTYPSFREMGENVSKRTNVIQLPVIAPQTPTSPDVLSACLPTASLDGPTESKNITWVIHSSGSTGHPKPIYQTHSGALKNYANNFGLKGFITLPLFHAHGISCLFRAIHSQKLIYMYNASLPLTATCLLTTLKENSEIQVLYAVPYALKLLSESEEGLESMARLELVMFGGSSCPKPIGDTLVQNGVRLVSHYGTTETGQLMTSFRERSDLDWDYVRPGPSLLPYLRWEEQPGMPGIYELCVMEGWPSKVASNRPDNSYATKDLFEKHPITPNAWRYYARLDDTLVLENGEKANPLVIEGVARKNPNVGEAIAFGSTKPRVGLFLIPSDKCTFQTDEELLDNVFPEIEACNAESPAYAYVSRDMIRVLPRDAVYRKTDKGTVIRSAFYKDFADNINEVYDSLDVQGERVLERNELIDFLRGSLLEIVPSVQSSSLGDSTDVFSLGIDSLQSIRLRTAIIRVLDLGGKKLSQNFVFENPSLQAMADQITSLRLGQGLKEQGPVEERMKNLIEKYSSGFKIHVPIPRDEDGEYIVLTGATGSLGAHIAAQLAESDRVKRIYCLVRAKSIISARRRVAQSLRIRALILSPAAERKIIALSSDLANSENLGLDAQAFAQIKRSVTTVIHCAWSVNFNWALESFEQSCIAPTRNLLDLCLSAEGLQPASFAFCSSVSTVSRTPGSWVPEALPESLSYAQGMGYAQSKLVAENIVNRAARQTGMTARVLRAGQIVADTIHGIWNATEAIPMIFQTAKTIKALPQLDDVLSWTPVDVMARSIVDLSLAPTAGEIMNVTNPTLSHWTHDLLPRLKEAGLNFEELPKQTWLQRLRESNQDPEVNPPVKLLEFFASKYDNNNPSRALLYDTKKAQEASPTLASAQGLDTDFTSRFVNYFTTQCWVKAPTPALPREVIFLIGPCGCGKSTAGQALQQRLAIPVIEGDNLHSPLARQKMASNLPLQDSDRWDWLAHIRGAVMDRLLHSEIPAVAVTCSALRTVYRDELRRLSQLFDFPVTVTFLFLSSQDREQLKQRMVARFATENHYMKSTMVDSQLDLLEDPTDEPDVFVLDSSQPREQMLDNVVDTARGILKA